MSGLGIVVSFLLLLWCSLLFVPFRGRPVGIYLIIEKALAVAYAPFIAAIATALAVVGAVFRSWWIAVPAGLAAAAAIVVVVRVGSVRVDLTGVLGADWDDRIPSRLRRQMVHRWWTLPAHRPRADDWLTLWRTVFTTRSSRVRGRRGPLPHPCPTDQPRRDPHHRPLTFGSCGRDDRRHPEDRRTGTSARGRAVWFVCRPAVVWGVVLLGARKL